VDRVEREQQRDLEARLRDRDLLHPADLGGIGDAQDRAQSLADLVVGRLEVRQQRELLELLLQRHLGEQVVHPPLDAAIRRLPGGRQRLLVAGT
jgi:hypothetical protein